MWLIWGLAGMFVIAFALAIFVGAIWYTILALFGFDLDKDEKKSKGDGK